MNKKDNPIDILTIIQRIWQKKKLFMKVTAITFVMSCLLILPVPRYYNSSVTLAPEIGDIMASNSLASMASSFGLNVGNNSTGDAIYPDLYPDLINSNDFVANLIYKKITTDDGETSITYYEYLAKHQKKNPLLLPFAWLQKIVTSIFTQETSTKEKKQIDFFRLTEKENGIIEKIKHQITCSINIKNGMIVISVQDQDPLVAATMAEETRKELQHFITNYRTNKARIDFEYYNKLTIDAKKDYEKARLLYGKYADGNMDVYLESYKLKLNDLENDMQIKFNTYNTLNSQLQSAKAKIQENTPVFTVIKSATIPIRPSGPKRMLFVLVMIVFCCTATAIYSCKDIIRQILLRNIR